MFKKIFKKIFVKEIIVYKRVGTTIECNAMNCIENENGNCALYNISLTKDKINSKNEFVCSEYCPEDKEMIADTNSAILGNNKL